MDFRIKRLELRLSQAELARLAGCAQTTISNIERGKGVDPKYKAKIEKILKQQA